MAEMSIDKNCPACGGENWLCEVCEWKEISNAHANGIHTPTGSNNLLISFSEPQETKDDPYCGTRKYAFEYYIPAPQTPPQAHRIPVLGLEPIDISSDTDSAYADPEPAPVQAPGPQPERRKQPKRGTEYVLEVIHSSRAVVEAIVRRNYPQPPPSPSDSGSDFDEPLPSTKLIPPLPLPRQPVIKNNFNSQRLTRGQSNPIYLNSDSDSDLQPEPESGVFSPSSQPKATPATHDRSTQNSVRQKSVPRQASNTDPDVLNLNKCGSKASKNSRRSTKRPISSDSGSHARSRDPKTGLFLPGPIAGFNPPRDPKTGYFLPLSQSLPGHPHREKRGSTIPTPVETNSESGARTARRRKSALPPPFHGDLSSSKESSHSVTSGSETESEADEYVPEEERTSTRLTRVSVTPQPKKLEKKSLILVLKMDGLRLREVLEGMNIKQTGVTN